MDSLNQRIANLSPEKRALLEQRLMQKQQPIAPATIPLRDRSTLCPLSFSQERLWFLDQLQPHQAVYNIPTAMRIEGALAIETLQAALDAIVDRHEILRTTIQQVEGNPVQVIAERRSVPLSVHDLHSRWAEDNPELESWLTQKSQIPFDLKQDGMLRASLFCLPDSEQVLLLVVHHIAADGWSINILWRELAAFYTAFANKTPIALPPLPVQYSDFADWQRQQLETDVFQSHLHYWTQQLHGDLPHLELPSNYPRPAVQTFHGARQALLLPQSLTEQLKKLSQHQGATLFMTLLASFKVLLHRYTGQDDIVVGSPIASRTQLEVEGLIGFFINTLVLRTHLGGNPTFLELLQQVRETALGAYAHQDLPFEKLVETLQPERHLNYTPLLQGMFVLQNTPNLPIKLANLSLTPVPVHTETAKFDLVLSLEESSQGLKGTIAYNTDLFDAATIQRLIGHYQTLLNAIVVDPTQPIAHLPLLTAAEQDQLLVQWNQTSAPVPDASLHQLFEAQVDRTPDAIAIVFADEALTYQELNQRANQLAHYLSSVGVGTETLVGICLERSPDLILSILAILKAGGAYVPLDLTYPADRLAFMLADTQIPILITQSHLKTQFSGRSFSCIYLDTDGHTIAQSSPTNLVTQATGDSLAYVLYTSGSTGQPKGILIPHKAVSRLVINTHYVEFQTTDAIAQVSSCSFDAATFEIWGALLHGARLVIIPKDVLLSPPEFAAQLSQHAVTILFLTTALFNQLVNDVPTAFAGVRYLLFGGEAADPQRVRQILSQQPPQHLLNVYGPTENTTFSTWYEVQTVSENANTIPIGRPIANTQLYVLDRALQPVPIGVPGELYLGGAGLARGYLNRPELTAERFIDPPAGIGEASICLYKTGDRVRYLPDGNLEFLGRVDQQVKIRGFRIEPGEIEAVLEQHPAVRDAVVEVRATQTGEKQLVAYAVPHAGQAITLSDLRRFLKQTLPDYMMPSTIVLLETLPLTANGKVDRRALPDPALTPAETETEATAPADNLELQLLMLWEEILGVQPIRVDDNFFNLGGHSLMALRLFTAIEAQFGRSLPITALFQAPTVSQFAATLRDVGWSAPWSLLVPIQPRGSKPPFFCVAGGDGNVLFFGDLMRHFDSDQPFYGIQAQGIEGDQPILTELEAMAAQNLRELRSLQPEGPYYLGGHSSGGLIALEMAQQLISQGQQVGLLALLEPSIPGSVLFRLPMLKRLNYLRQFALLHRLLYQFEMKLRRLFKRDRRKQLNFLLQKAIGRLIPNPLTSNLPPQPSHAQQFQKPAYPSSAAIWAATTQAVARYLPQRYPYPITLFLCDDSLRDSAALGNWQALAGANLKIQRVPGKHATCMQEPYVAELVEQLQNCLEKRQPHH